jgi:hypothetical protein
MAENLSETLEHHITSFFTAKVPLIRHECKTERDMYVEEEVSPRNVQSPNLAYKHNILWTQRH